MRKSEHKNGKLLFSKRNVEKIARFFRSEDPVEIKVGRIKGAYGIVCDNTITINKKMNDTNKIITLVHELIHYVWKLDHDAIGNYCGYYCSKHDHLSEAVASIIFKRKLVWEDE